MSRYNNITKVAKMVLMLAPINNNLNMCKIEPKINKKATK
jgi:hypothetical protein